MNQVQNFCAVVDKRILNYISSMFSVTFRGIFNCQVWFLCKSYQISLNWFCLWRSSIVISEMHNCYKTCLSRRIMQKMKTKTSDIKVVVWIVMWLLHISEWRSHCKNWYPGRVALIKERVDSFMKAFMQWRVVCNFTNEDKNKHMLHLSWDTFLLLSVRTRMER